MKFTHALAAVILICSQALTAAYAQPRDTLQKIKETGVINLGGRDASFPFSYKLGAEGHPIGFSADLCMKVVEAVRSKLGMPNLKVEYTMVTPTNRIPLLQNGTIDLECSTTTNTVARAQQVEFAPTHFVGSVAAAVKKGSGINGVAQLDGKTVATVSGSTSIQLLRSYRKSENVQFAEVSGKDTSETFLLLSSDRAVAMVLEDVQLAGLIARSGNSDQYKILDERLRDEPYGFMVIEPGDLIVGDDDGLVSVPFAQAEAICELSAAKQQKEASTFADIGKTDNDALGYRKKLLSLGCTFEE